MYITPFAPVYDAHIDPKIDQFFICVLKNVMLLIIEIFTILVT